MYTHRKKAAATVNSLAPGNHETRCYFYTPQKHIAKYCTNM